MRLSEGAAVPQTCPDWRLVLILRAGSGTGGQMESAETIGPLRLCIATFFDLRTGALTLNTALRVDHKSIISSLVTASTTTDDDLLRSRVAEL